MTDWEANVGAALELAALALAVLGVWLLTGSAGATVLAMSAVLLLLAWSLSGRPVGRDRR